MDPRVEKMTSELNEVKAAINSKIALAEKSLGNLKDVRFNQFGMEDDHVIDAIELCKIDIDRLHQELERLNRV